MNIYPSEDARRAQVMVVDDVEGAADDYARLIAQQSKLVVAATRYPDEAIEALSTNPILVVVLDQVFDHIDPPTTGTEIYSRLQTVSTDFAAIMLSAEGGFDDAGEANRLGYEEILDKSEVDRLPRVVRNLYFGQLAARASSQSVQQRQLVAPKRRLGLARVPAVFVSELDVLDDEYVDDDDWHTHVQVNAGEEVTREVALGYEQRVRLAATSRINLKANLGGKVLKAVKGNVESKIESTFGEALDEDRSLSQRLTVTRSLPQPEHADGRYVQTRNYQYAPVYRRVKVELLVLCEECKGSSLTSVEALVATGRFASRHEDILSDGEKKIIMTSTAL